MPISLDLSGLRFAAPAFLVLLWLPALLLVVWGWQAWRRRGDVTRMRRHRHLPNRSATERLPVLGDLLFWLCLVVALGWVIVALARPVGVASLVRTSGIDLVILQDGSASMRVRDVRGDRWRRSMLFLRTLGESLQWEDDRVAMALFATIATPQIRLTRDPNTFFFFLDHLQDEPPFRLEDDTTWDTNIERGIYWGMRLIDRDLEMRKRMTGLTASAQASAVKKPGPGAVGGGRQPSGAGTGAGPAATRGADRQAGPADNPKAFVLISDGQAWSGSVAKSLAAAQERRIPLFVVGVGTTAGGVIPQAPTEVARAAITSSLDRSSLATIATSGGGRYFELDRESDRDIANAIIDATRRRAEAGNVEETTRDLYWPALAAAAIFLGLGVLFMRDRASLALQLIAGVAALIVLARVS